MELAPSSWHHSAVGMQKCTAAVNPMRQDMHLCGAHHICKGHRVCAPRHPEHVFTSDFDNIKRAIVSQHDVYCKICFSIPACRYKTVPNKKCHGVKDLNLQIVNIDELTLVEPQEDGYCITV